MDLDAAIAARKLRLDALRPLSAGSLAALADWYDVELTYTSNAIEGSTLTRIETSIVLEKGITVSGKPLKDHLDAIDHLEALRFVRATAEREGEPIGEATIRRIHALVVARTMGAEAGVYSRHQRRVAGAMVAFPTPQKVPELMAAFGAWLSTAEVGYAIAFEAHDRLVTIHPFSDGNVRTARLLMNLVLLRAGFPPVAIGPDHRVGYLDALQTAQTGGARSAYDTLMRQRLLASLDDHIAHCEQGLS